MFVFPASPVAPETFFEEIVPAIFADLAVDEGTHGISIKIGVHLGDAEGAGPVGTWTLQLLEGELRVCAGREADCDLTIVQSVSDWRSALWEGRPRLIADAVAALTNSGSVNSWPGAPEAAAGRPESLKGLRDLRGLIEFRIAGADAAGEVSGGQAADDDRDVHDWRLGIQLGPGAIPDCPDATIQLGAAEAEAIRRGELHPLEALMTGQLRLEGDLGLILQLQAIAMMGLPSVPSTGSQRSRDPQS